MTDTISQIMEYAVQHSSGEDEILTKLYRETNLKTLYPRMLSGHMQGKLLELISYMIRPGRILEIGTFTGYSAICLAKGLAQDGVLHTIDINDELADIALKYFKLAGLDNEIRLHTGDARMIIPVLDEQFDLVFIDGEKSQYMQYYELVLPKVKTGGFIIADNVLWNGKVLPGTKHNDKETRGIRDFNDFVATDFRVEKMLLPFRDGLFILRKLRDRDR
jgi:predicted O-methyltransferase YrrM